MGYREDPDLEKKDKQNKVKKDQEPKVQTEGENLDLADKHLE